MIYSVTQARPTNIENTMKISEKQENKVGFSDFLKKAIYDVNDAKKYEQALAEQLIAGNLESMHELSIARSVANVKFQALTEGVSKIAEAYKEISRMQI